MTAAEYKKVCEQPDAFTRSMLERTSRLLPSNAALQAKLQATLTQEPISRPISHQEIDGWADHFRVHVSKTEADEIISALLSAEAEAVSPSGETTPDATFFADGVDLWVNYREFQEEQQDKDRGHR